MGQIQYSEKYFDDTYEYRHVVLPPDVAKLLPKNRLLSEVSDPFTSRILMSGVQLEFSRAEDGCTMLFIDQSHTSCSSGGH
nr:cyclin-dependent kinases regulatory subunit isoform X2 [Nicotiana tomentosiformis]